MKSVTHTKSFELDISAEQLFPLFSPEGEKYWVPGWDYTNIMGTTELSEDYIFMTKNHDHGKADAIWLVKKYDPKSYYVQFYKIEPEEKVGIVTVQCFLLSPEKTKIQVSYKYTALSESGEAFVSGFDKNKYDAFIKEWETLLVEYHQKLG
jgi:hypothetical protein